MEIFLGWFQILHWAIFSKPNLNNFKIQLENVQNLPVEPIIPDYQKPNNKNGSN